jgi:hypothetical protein
MSHGTLAQTGASVTILGLAIGQLWMLAAVLILVGAVAIGARYGFRRDRRPQD